jgi:diguanylate cyclase (GGDEF)-like protein
VTDGLTGLFNHAYFLSALRRETQRSKRHGLKLSLAMLDLDDFKLLNDTHGHLAGDGVLMKAASLMTQSLREVDIAARYGGEEFALILPDTPRMGAFVVADRIRKRVEEHFRRRKGGPAVTLSGGVATFPDDAADLEQLIKRADEGLYRSKGDGKNRVTVSGGERRQHPRVPVTHRVTVRAEGQAAAARAKNLSEGGLLVSFARAVPVGSPLDVTLRPRGGAAFGVRGEVVRVEPYGAQGRVLYDLGLRFLAEPGGPSLPLLRRLISDV